MHARHTVRAALLDARNRRLQPTMEGAELMVHTIYSRSSLLLVLAGLGLLIGDSLQVLDSMFAWTVVLAISFVLFAAGLLLLPLSTNTQRRALVVAGSLCAFLGAIAGASMQSLFRAWAVLKEAGHSESLNLLQAHAGIRFTTLVPGVLFPLGLLLLAIGLYLTRQVSLAVGITLALGAILFPIGHAIGVEAALLGSDIVLLAGFIALHRTTASLRRQAQ
jgi:uncharacterized membrane protein